MRNKQEERDKRINSRCDTLIRILKAIRPIYLKSSAYDQGFIETMIGAAIWYIPKPPSAWTGMISLEVLKSFHPNISRSPKISEEHIFPRKMVGKKLLNNKDLPFRKFQKLFREKYGKVHYITPAENKILVRFQKSHILSGDVYKKAGIKLIKISLVELKQVKRRNKVTIVKLCKVKKSVPKSL